MFSTPLGNASKKKLGLATFAVLQREARGTFRTRTFFNLVLSQQNNKSPQFQIPDALWRYQKLLHLFNRSLENIKKMGMQKELEMVNDWHQLFEETRQLVHVSFILWNNFKVTWSPELREEILCWNFKSNVAII